MQKDKKKPNLTLKFEPNGKIPIKNCFLATDDPMNFYSQI